MILPANRLGRLSGNDAKMSKKPPTLLPFIQKEIAEKKRYLINEKIVAWVTHNASNKGYIENFYGKKIGFSGCKFEGSPRDVFWGGFIEPFLEDFTNDMLTRVCEECEKNKLNIRSELDALEQNMRGMFLRIYEEMSKADQRMRGEGYPDKVDKKNTSSYVANMNYYLDQHLAMVLGKYKSKNSIKHKVINSIEEQALTWLAGILFLIPGAVWKYWEIVYKFFKMTFPPR